MIANNKYRNKSKMYFFLNGNHCYEKHKKRKRIDFLDCFEKLEQLLQRKGCLCPESRFMTTDAKPNQRLKRTLSASLWMALKEDEQVKGD